MLIIILSIIYGFIFSYGVGAYTAELELNFFISFLILILAMVLNIILHEMGHYIAARISGYKFVLFRIFSITFVKEDGKIKRKHFDITGTLGQNLMIPKQKIGEDYPYLLYHFGGVIMNFLVGLIFIAVLIFTRGIFSYFAYCMAGVAFYVALTNGIPINTTIANDGFNAMTSYKNPASRLLIHTSLVLSANYLKAMGVSDLSEEEIETIKKEQQKYLEFGAIMVDYYAENGDFKRSEELVEESLKKEVLLGDIHKQVLIGENLFYKLLKRDEEEILKYNTKEFKKFRKKILSKLINKYHIEYAFALYEEDFDKAKKIKEEFMKYRKNYPFIGQANLIEKQMNYADKLIGEK